MPGNDKTRVTVGNVTLELPASLVKTQDKAVDSAAGLFEGSGVTVIVDQGPFADRLNSYVGHPGYREETRNVGGIAARMISFHRPEQGTYTMAVHLPAPKPATIVVHANASVPERIPKGIIESLRLLD